MARHKLTERQRAEIGREPATTTHAELAVRYGVSIGTIRQTRTLARQARAEATREVVRERARDLSGKAMGGMEEVFDISLEAYRQTRNPAHGQLVRQTALDLLGMAPSPADYERTAEMMSSMDEETYAAVLVSLQDRIREAQTAVAVN